MKLGPLFILCLLAFGCSEDSGLIHVKSVLEVEPASLDFGALEVLSKAGRHFTLASVGTQAVVVTDMTLERESDVFELRNTVSTLEPDKRATIDIDYAPTTEGEHSNVVVIKSTADEGALLRVVLEARAYSLADPCIDEDGDTYGTDCTAGPDCDDTDADIRPGAFELCNGFDDNCDDVADEGFALGDVCSISFDLPDGSSCVRGGLNVCAGNGRSAECMLNPAPEVCDGVDNDCNGTIDDPYSDVGTACTIFDGQCDKPGTFQCGADTASTECILTDPLAGCCDPGLQENSAGVCCAPMPGGACSYTCQLDVATGVHDCTGPVTVDDVSNQMALLTVDMTGHTSLEVDVEACNPTGHWIDISDSPSCNGFGGDGGSFSNDAELHVHDSELRMYANDHVVGPNPLITSNPYAPTGCGSRVFGLSDQQFQSFDPCLSLQSPYALRLNPPADNEGLPDALWYVGLNRVTGSTSRTGTGVTEATLCLR